MSGPLQPLPIGRAGAGPWTPGPAAAAAAPPTSAVECGPLCGRGFGLYLILAALLCPLTVPAGPGQTAVLDGVNVVGLAAFALVVVMWRIPVELPLALPLALVATGSLLAMTGALSLPLALETLAQDLYLYLWFVALVTLLERRGDSVGVRRAWVVAAVGVALAVLAQSFASGGFPRGMFAARGARPGGTFANPNLCADYLALSVFVTLGLARHLRLRWRVAATALIGLAVIATRSNGGLISLLAGLVTWAVARAWTAGVPKPAISGWLALGAAGTLLALWAVIGWGAGGGILHRLSTESYFGRVTHSGESRAGIWKHLDETLGRWPLGIGPGNSSARTMRIGENERPDHNLQSKEAHSDYLGYLVERGPIAFLGLLLGTALVFARVIRTRRRRDPLWVAALLGALVATTVHATVIERLHFRHVWLFLALAWALPRERPRAAQPARTGEERWPRPAPGAALPAALGERA